MIARNWISGARAVAVVAGFAAAGPCVAAGPETAAVAEGRARGSETNLPLPRFVSMRAESANARRGPNLDQRIDWEFVRRGLPLEVTAEYGHWRRVRDAEGLGGWVHYSLLSGIRTALVTGDAPVALRDEPDDGAVVRAMAEPGVVARLEACQGSWCEIEAGGVEGWLPRGAIWGVTADEAFD